MSAMKTVVGLMVLSGLLACGGESKSSGEGAGGEAAKTKSLYAPMGVKECDEFLQTMSCAIGRYDEKSKGEQFVVWGRRLEKWKKMDPSAATKDCQKEYEEQQEFAHEYLKGRTFTCFRRPAAYPVLEKKKGLIMRVFRPEDDHEENAAGFPLTEDLKMVATWRTAPGLQLEVGGKTVTATGNTVKTTHDLVSLIAPALKKLKLPPSDWKGYAIDLRLEVAWKDKPAHKRTRVIKVRLDDALALLIENTVKKGKPFLLPGESAELAGKGMHMTSMKPSAPMQGFYPALSIEGGPGAWADVDGVTKLTSKGGKYACHVWNRRTGKKLGVKKIKRARKVGQQCAKYYRKMLAKK
jgi:hypothetical protein